MALQTSGQIAMSDIMTELGISGQTAMNDADVRALIDKTSGAQMSMSEWYGASSEYVLTGNAQEITASTYISSGGTLRFTGGYIWSDNTSNAGITLDIPCTFINEGKVMGKGGRGGDSYQSGFNGGPAIRVTSTGVTIVNNSGAYIAGGGGGGAGSAGASWRSGGGGGAGGGRGGNGSSSGGAAGGAIGSNGGSTGGAFGGPSGGSGVGYFDYDRGPAHGGAGGGRILPSSTSAGSNGGYIVGSVRGAGNGGGWGANGGTGGGGGSGLGGAAITGTSRTLTNNGNVYGST